MHKLVVIWQYKYAKLRNSVLNSYEKWWTSFIAFFCPLCYTQKKQQQHEGE